MTRTADDHIGSCDSRSHGRSQDIASRQYRAAKERHHVGLAASQAREHRLLREGQDVTESQEGGQRVRIRRNLLKLFAAPLFHPSLQGRFRAMGSWCPGTLGLGAPQPAGYVPDALV